MRTRMAWTGAAAIFAGFLGAGCMGPTNNPAGASLSNGELTVVVASPQSNAEFAPGDSVPFEIEIYQGDKTLNAHPGAGGHYHARVEGFETVTMASDVPVFGLQLPENISNGTHAFRIEYHDGDGESSRFRILLPFRVVSR